MLNICIVFYCMLTSIIHETKDESKYLESMALINNISFHNAKYSKNNVGNGFIVKVKGLVYAITAKHVLMIAKTDKMKFVELSDELKQWKMFNKHNKSEFLIVDKLLNANKNEKLDWETLTNDWLVFSIKENKTGYQPLTFRSKPLMEDEVFYVVGWAYEDKIGAQRIYEFKYDETKNGSIHLKQIKGPESLAGLSGAPVVDNQNNVIGLVSTGWFDEKTKTTYLQASQAIDIKNFIESH